MKSNVEQRRALEAFLDVNTCTLHSLYCVRSEFCGYRPKPADIQTVLIPGVLSGVDKKRGLSPDFWERQKHV